MYRPCRCGMGFCYRVARAITVLSFDSTSFNSISRARSMAYISRPCKRLRRKPCTALRTMIWREKWAGFDSAHRGATSQSLDCPLVDTCNLRCRHLVRAGALGRAENQGIFSGRTTPQGFAMSLDEAQVFAWHLLNIISPNVRSAEDYTAYRSGLLHRQHSFLNTSSPLVATQGFGQRRSAIARLSIRSGVFIGLNGSRGGTR